MTGSDEAIDKVLAGLRTAEVPEGMERRILRSVEERAVMRSRWGWHGYRAMWLGRPVQSAGLVPVVSAVALASILAGSLTILLIHGYWQAPTQKTLGTTAPESHPHTARTVFARDEPVFPVMRARRVSTQTRPRSSAFAADGDSLARREMLAASMPAPPVPLTKQERLLLRVAQKGDPEEIAMLNPEVRAKEQAESKAEFVNFFEPPRARENKPIEQ